MARADEIESMYGVGAQVFAQFYNKLQDIKDYHKQYPNIEVERPEAEILLNRFYSDEDVDIPFSLEESYGLHVDLNEKHQKYINLKGASQQVDYVEYLQKFYKFEDNIVKTETAYKEYLKEVLEYLVSFFVRSKPLFDTETPLNESKKRFSEQWEAKSFTPIGCTTLSSNTQGSQMEMDDDESPPIFNNGADQLLPWVIESNLNNSLYCGFCRKTFSKDTVFKAHINSSKHMNVKQRYQDNIREVFLIETQINELASMLSDVLEDTKEFLQNKQARRYDEGASDLGIDMQNGDEDDTDKDEVKLMKLHYPVGWDGQPIPYWLYKLYGLGQEFKCEICGNTSYWGRRAFEKHFTELRHAHGMKCLGLENTKEFFEITKINDVKELAKKLEKLKNENKWVSSTMEEFEDPEGYVVDKETYDLLSKNV